MVTESTPTGGSPVERVVSTHLAPIERDEGYDRTFIPLPGGWEMQTKGKGSTFRLVNPSGFRLAIPDLPYLHGTLERLARDIHAAVSANA